MQTVDSHSDVSVQSRSEVIAQYSDPIMLYCYALISTLSANTLDSVCANFPPHLIEFAKKCVVRLEADSLIDFADGLYRANENSVFTKITKSRGFELIPSFIDGAAKRVLKDVDDGTYAKKSEDLNLYYVSDNPQVRARIKALTAHINKEMREITELNVDSNGVRVFAYVNSLPGAEDLS